MIISDLAFHTRKKEQHDGEQQAKFHSVNYPFSAAVRNDKYRLNMSNSQSSLPSGRTLQTL